jgi:(4S)-4-hydroxy-5-phosphonooxypentane-2,3-dione isomerase
MMIVQVYVRVRPERIDDFKAATRDNARNSVKEPGIARFDVLQREDDPSRFVLIEAYRDAGAPARHRETAHYAAWRSIVEEMMAEPRRSEKYTAVFPDDGGWGMP